MGGVLPVIDEMLGARERAVLCPFEFDLTKTIARLEQGGHRHHRAREDLGDRGCPSLWAGLQSTARHRNLENGHHHGSASEFLHHQAKIQQASARASVGFAEGNAQKALGDDLLPEPRVPALVGLEFANGVEGRLGLEELAHGFLQEPLGFAEIEIHFRPLARQPEAGGGDDVAHHFVGPAPETEDGGEAEVELGLALEGRQFSGLGAEPAIAPEQIHGGAGQPGAEFRARDLGHGGLGDGGSAARDDPRVLQRQRSVFAQVEFELRQAPANHRVGEAIRAGRAQMRHQLIVDPGETTGGGEPYPLVVQGMHHDGPAWLTPPTTLSTGTRTLS